MIIRFRSPTKQDAVSARPYAGVIASLGIVGALCGTIPSHAASFEQIIASCRESVGRPIVQACMRAQGGAGDLEACRAKASPTVRACVQKEVAKQAAKKPPPAAPVVKETAPKDLGGAAPAGFVAPPRTIADIRNSRAGKARSGQDRENAG